MVETASLNLSLPSPPTMRDVDGRLVVDWRGVPPHWFAMTAELFDQLVTEINDLRAELEVRGA